MATIPNPQQALNEGENRREISLETILNAIVERVHQNAEQNVDYVNLLVEVHDFQSPPLEVAFVEQYAAIVSQFTARGWVVLTTETSRVLTIQHNVTTGATVTNGLR